MRDNLVLASYIIFAFTISFFMLPVEDDLKTQPDYVYKATVLNIVDGDTVDLEVDLGFNITMKDRFRLYGINAPEVRGAEKLEGRKSTEWLTAQLKDQDLIIKTEKDKRGKFGRWLCTLYVNSKDLNLKMVEEGFAKKADY